MNERLLVEDNHCDVITGGWCGSVCGVSSIDNIDAGQVDKRSEFEEQHLVQSTRASDTGGGASPCLQWISIAGTL